jgi:hypothetical protein
MPFFKSNIDSLSPALPASVIRRSAVSPLGSRASGPWTGGLLTDQVITKTHRRGSISQPGYRRPRKLAAAVGTDKTLGFGTRTASPAALYVAPGAAMIELWPSDDT